jgi:hypothetical protein
MTTLVNDFLMARDYTAFFGHCNIRHTLGPPGPTQSAGITNPTDRVERVSGFPILRDDIDIALDAD